MLCAALSSLSDISSCNLVLLGPKNEPARPPQPLNFASNPCCVLVGAFPLFSIACRVSIAFMLSAILGADLSISSATAFVITKSFDLLPFSVTSTLSFPSIPVPLFPSLLSDSRTRLLLSPLSSCPVADASVSEDCMCFPFFEATSSPSFLSSVPMFRFSSTSDTGSDSRTASSFLLSLPNIPS